MEGARIGEYRHGHSANLRLYGGGADVDKATFQMNVVLL